MYSMVGDPLQHFSPLFTPPSPPGFHTSRSLLALMCSILPCIYMCTANLRLQRRGGGSRKEEGWETGEGRSISRLCFAEREREEMGGSITHPDRQEGRADGMLVPQTEVEGKWEWESDEEKRIK